MSDAAKGLALVLAMLAFVVACGYALIYMASEITADRFCGQHYESKFCQARYNKGAK